MNYTKCNDKDKPNFLQTASAEQIQRHTDQVRQGLDPCYLPPCPRCGLDPDFFKHHDKCSRIFYIIVELVVIKVPGLLSRWKCPGCKKTNPSFLLSPGISHAALPGHFPDRDFPQVGNPIRLYIRYGPS